MRGVIRDFEERDYGAVVLVQNASYPEHPRGAEQWRHRDASTEAKIKWRRFVYEEDQQLLAYGGYMQWEIMYHPRKFHLYVCVHPEHRRRSIGAALYDHVVTALEAFDPLVLRCFARENMADGMRFIAQRGYRETIRERESELNLKTFAPAAYASDLERVRAAGYEINTYAELAGDPDLQRQIFELDMIVSEDVPMDDVLTRPDFAAYCRVQFKNPHFMPEFYMLARDGAGDLVGMSNLWRREVPGSLATDLTGVLRECRGQGVATALKVCVLGAAKEAGYESVLTENEVGNTRMLGINRRLGFKPRPAWIGFEKVLKEEP